MGSWESDTQAGCMCYEADYRMGCFLLELPEGLGHHSLLIEEWWGG